MGDPIMNRGFSLVELVIVIAVVGILAGSFVAYVEQSVNMFETVDNRKEITMEARQAMLRIIREVRQIRDNTSIVSANANGISFFGVADSLYTLTYSGTPGTNLMFQRGAVSAAIATGVDSLSIQYFKSDGTAAVPVVSPGVTDVHRVSVYLRLASGGDKVSFSTETFLRNLQ